MAQSGQLLDAGSSAGERLGDSRAGALPLRRRLGPWLYGGLFVVVLPLALVLWARAAAGVVPLPPLRLPLVGGGIALAGAALWLGAVRELIVRGRGLPMNAYPPTVRVTSGPYRLLAHPVYAGAALVALGAAVASGSAAALWLVVPVFVLAMVALVAGFERIDTLKRLGPSAARPLLTLPLDQDAPAGTIDRIVVYLLVFLPWLATYYGVQHLGVPFDAFPLELAWEQKLPVWQWAEAVYASCYLMVPLVPLLLRRRSQLRAFALRGLLATVVVGLLWVLIPAAEPHRLFQPTSALGRMLAWERASTNGTAAFPSFHVLWALLAADALAGLSRRWAIGGWAWAVAISASAAMTGMHALADIVAAVLLFPLLRSPDRAWEAVRRSAERVANSWREWRFGSLRIINHGLYVGLGSFVGYVLISAAARPGEPAWAIPAVALATLLGAGIWGQLLESSSGLLRPFGYYGGIVGGIGAAVLAGALGADTMLLLAACALAGPWVQLLGRLRCLVQGCCHGAPAAPWLGIRYRHPRSRVSALAHLAGEPLHPTPLYSIVSNLVLGLMLLRLWSLGAALCLILGVYLIGNGLARFVEEGYRGEPQTAVLGGLHVYQWLAIASVLAGAWASTLDARPAPPLAALGATDVLPALAFGLLTAFAMGVDWPASNRRFSRLAGGEETTFSR